MTVWRLRDKRQSRPARIESIALVDCRSAISTLCTGQYSGRYALCVTGTDRNKTMPSTLRNACNSVHTQACHSISKAVPRKNNADEVEPSKKTIVEKYEKQTVSTSSITGSIRVYIPLIRFSYIMCYEKRINGVQTDPVGRWTELRAMQLSAMNCVTQFDWRNERYGELLSRRVENSSRNNKRVNVRRQTDGRKNALSVRVLLISRRDDCMEAVIIKLNCGHKARLCSNG